MWPPDTCANGNHFSRRVELFFSQVQSKSAQIMSIITAVHEYVTSILNRVVGMKILLVDSDTIGIVSMVLSQSQILEQEVFLVEVIDKAGSNEPTDQGANMKHLKAVALLRPSTANFLSLTKELKAPRFSEYHLCMSSPSILWFHFNSSFHKPGTT